MSGFSLEQLILALAEEFKRREMPGHLDALRVYYRWYRARRRWLEGKRPPPWTEENVIRWATVFRIEPFENALAVLSRSAPCPACPHVPAWAAPVASWVFPGGEVMRCPKCGAQWLALYGGGE